MKFQKEEMFTHHKYFLHRWNQDSRLCRHKSYSLKCIFHSHNENYFHCNLNSNDYHFSIHIKSGFLNKKSFAAPLRGISNTSYAGMLCTYQLQCALRLICLRKIKIYYTKAFSAFLEHLFLINYRRVRKEVYNMRKVGRFSSTANSIIVKRIYIGDIFFDKILLDCTKKFWSDVLI